MTIVNPSRKRRSIFGQRHDPERRFFLGASDEETDDDEDEVDDLDDAFVSDDEAMDEGDDDSTEEGDDDGDDGDDGGGDDEGSEDAESKREAHLRELRATERRLESALRDPLLYMAEREELLGQINAVRQVIAQRETEATDLAWADMVVHEVTGPRLAASDHSMHTDATDWLGKIATYEEAGPGFIEIEAATWLRSSRAVLDADPEEWATQAHGAAQRLAGHLPGGPRVFLDALVRLAADGEEEPDEEQSGEAVGDADMVSVGDEGTFPTGAPIADPTNAAAYAQEQAGIGVIGPDGAVSRRNDRRPFVGEGRVAGLTVSPLPGRGHFSDTPPGRVHDARDLDHVYQIISDYALDAPGDTTYLVNDGESPVLMTADPSGVVINEMKVASRKTAAEREVVKQELGGDLELVMYPGIGYRVECDNPACQWASDYTDRRDRADALFDGHQHGSPSGGVSVASRKTADAFWDEIGAQLNAMRSAKSAQGNKLTASRRTAGDSDLANFLVNTKFHPSTGFKVYDTYQVGPGRWVNHFNGPLVDRPRLQLFTDETGSGIGSIVDTVYLTGGEDLASLILPMIGVTASRRTADWRSGQPPCSNCNHAMSSHLDDDRQTACRTCGCANYAKGSSGEDWAKSLGARKTAGDSTVWEDGDVSVRLTGDGFYAICSAPWCGYVSNITHQRFKARQWAENHRDNVPDDSQAVIGYKTASKTASSGSWYVDQLSDGGWCVLQEGSALIDGPWRDRAVAEERCDVFNSMGGDPSFMSGGDYTASKTAGTMEPERFDSFEDYVKFRRTEHEEAGGGGPTPSASHLRAEWDFMHNDTASKTATEAPGVGVGGQGDLMTGWDAETDATMPVPSDYDTFPGIEEYFDMESESPVITQSSRRTASTDAEKIERLIELGYAAPGARGMAFEDVIDQIQNVNAMEDDEIDDLLASL